MLSGGGDAADFYEEAPVVASWNDIDIPDEKLKKIEDYCKQLCDFGFEPDELCTEFKFTC